MQLRLTPSKLAIFRHMMRVKYYPEISWVFYLEMLGRYLVNFISVSMAMKTQKYTKLTSCPEAD
jgi:hypothetical protein